jgi:hypothetical protein
LLALALRGELLSQAYAEEKSLYPLFDQTPLRRSALELVAEHVHLLTLLKAFACNAAGAPGWHLSLETLAVAVHEHYRREEIELFEPARQLLTDEELLIAEELYLSFKRSALDSPQPAQSLGAHSLGA